MERKYSLKYSSILIHLETELSYSISKTGKRLCKNAEGIIIDREYSSFGLKPVYILERLEESQFPTYHYSLFEKFYSPIRKSWELLRKRIRTIGI